MPTGIYIRRRLENFYKKEYPTKMSFISTEWLANIEYTKNTHIQHARNGPEFRIGDKHLPVDGYCKYVHCW